MSYKLETFSIDYGVIPPAVTIEYRRKDGGEVLITDPLQYDAAIKFLKEVVLRDEN